MTRTLLLVPTQFELSLIDAQLIQSWLNGNSTRSEAGITLSTQPGTRVTSPPAVDGPLSTKIFMPGGNAIALCGFGMVVASARTAQLLAELKPDQVILIGMAGSIGDTLELGKAYRFSKVLCFGIGAGVGSNFVTASELGWEQWQGASVSNADSGVEASISDALDLQDSKTPLRDRSQFHLMTVSAASADFHDVRQKMEKYPNAVAEDMEGFAVAVACQLAGIPLAIIRGISNQAGDRDHASWRSQEAMDSAALLALESISK